MATVHDVAHYILETAGPMTAMKLQKLVYYSQAWSAALTEEAIFDESVRAWANGPVVYELFDLHRKKLVVSSWPRGSGKRLKSRHRQVIDRVLSSYGTLPAETLSAMSHAETPWKEARTRLPEGAPSSGVISADSMRDYFRKIRPPFGRV